MIDEEFHPATLESFLKHFGPARVSLFMGKNKIYTKANAKNLFNIVNIDPADKEGRKKLADELEAKGYFSTGFWDVY
jgi:hypothetical protein